MKLLIRFISLLILSAFLLSCSTYSKSQCENFDWQEEGHSFALKGKTQKMGLSHFNRACQRKHGIQPNLKQFKVGHKAGVKDFCTPENALGYGLEGGEYHGLCKGKNEKKLLKTYVKGVHVFYKSRVSQLEFEVSNLKSQISLQPTCN